MKNGYPEKLIQKRLETKIETRKVATVEKKRVYISLPFKGDTLALSTERRLSDAVSKAFGAAQLRVFYTSTPVICLKHKDTVPGSAASFCVYSFSCSCGTGYAG